MKLIQGKNIKKAFGDNLVLNNIDFTMDEGEFVAIMGPSGSGKSTLLYALSGMDGIDEGQVLFGTTDLTGLTEAKLADVRREQMGFIFQQPILLKNLNILDNIIIAQLLNSQNNPEQLLKKAQELMVQVGIAGLETRSITEVSGGQLQRAGICRAMLNTPKILFADEPTGALNSKVSAEIMTLFTDIHHQGTAILIVTHDAAVAAHAERVVFLKDGQVVKNLKGQITAEKIRQEMAELEI